MIKLTENEREVLWLMLKNLTFPVDSWNLDFEEINEAINTLKQKKILLSFKDSGPYQIVMKPEVIQSLMQLFWEPTCKQQQ